jgi:hypothetical protein
MHADDTLAPGHPSWQKGNSVLCHVHGFRPYFYVAAPPGFLSSDCTAFQDRLNVRQLPLGKSLPPHDGTNPQPHFVPSAVIHLIRKSTTRQKLLDPQEDVVVGIQG